MCAHHCWSEAAHIMLAVLQQWCLVARCNALEAWGWKSMCSIITAGTAVVGCCWQQLAGCFALGALVLCTAEHRG
jgi:hypothetical protein